MFLQTLCKASAKISVPPERKERSWSAPLLSLEQPLDRVIPADLKGGSQPIDNQGRATPHKRREGFRDDPFRKVRPTKSSRQTTPERVCDVVYISPFEESVHRQTNAAAGKVLRHGKRSLAAIGRQNVHGIKNGPRLRFHLPQDAP